MYNLNNGNFSTVSVQYQEYSNNSRRSIGSPKKKRRKYSNESLNVAWNSNNSALSRNQTNNISIIDRVLDIDKYNRSTGLYSLCRDWINATTSVSDCNRTVSMDTEEVEGGPEKERSYFVRELPRPEMDGTQATIGELNEAIGVNIRASQDSDLELIKALDVNHDQEIQTHALLKLHVRDL
jgi:hypothetical protein